jgi:hypothetical protein
MTASAHRIEIDAVDFQVSCRRFMIRATVTRDRQLPVVDEFVLRLLAVLDRMPVARMRSWFGFSETEIETVLLDMGRRKYVEFDGDDVLLAPAGRDLFRATGDGGVPQVVEVAPMIENVWFDLVSRNMVAKSRSANADYLVRLVEQPSAREFPEAFARQAFEENFRDYARRIRRLPDPDAVNLYSISDVEGGAYGYQLLPAGLVLDTDRMAVRTTFSDIGEDAPAFQKLTVAANDAWQSALPPEAAATTAAEFERMTGHGEMAGLIRSPDDADSWIRAMTGLGREETGFARTIGATYLTSNLARIVDMIAKSEGTGAQGELIWLRPGGSTWGRTLRVPEAIQLIRTAGRNSGNSQLQTTIAMPRSAHRSVRNNHKRLFDRGLLLPQGHLPANLEVLCVAGVAAFVNVHLRMGGHSVPIGGIVTDPKRLARIRERLNPSGAAGWEEVWRPTAPRAVRTAGPA